MLSKTKTLRINYIPKVKNGPVLCGSINCSASQFILTKMNLRKALVLSILVVLTAEVSFALDGYTPFNYNKNRLEVCFEIKTKSNESKSKMTFKYNKNNSLEELIVSNNDSVKKWKLYKLYSEGKIDSSASGGGNMSLLGETHIEWKYLGKEINDEFEIQELRKCKISINGANDFFFRVKTSFMQKYFALSEKGELISISFESQSWFDFAYEKYIIQTNRYKGNFKDYSLDTIMELIEIDLRFTEKWKKKNNKLVRVNSYYFNSDYSGSKKISDLPFFNNNSIALYTVFMSDSLLKIIKKDGQSDYSYKESKVARRLMKNENYQVDFDSRYEDFSDTTMKGKAKVEYAFTNTNGFWDNRNNKLFYTRKDREYSNIYKKIHLILIIKKKWFRSRVTILIK